MPGNYLLVISCLALFVCGVPARAQMPVEGVRYIEDIATQSDLPGSDERAESFDGTARPVHSSPQNLLLKGGVAHSDTLPPVDSSLREGATYDSALLPKLTPGNHWHWIPNWFAGHWRTETNTCYYVRDLRTGMSSRAMREMIARASEDVGFQKDAEGGIWEYEYKPYTARVDCGETFAVQLVQEHEPVEVTPQRVVYRFRGTDLHVDKRTRQIRRTSQVESIQIYTSTGRNAVRCTASIKSFDDAGQPVRIQRNVSAKVRTSDFRPIAVYKGRDMKAQFRAFLTLQGMTHLIPNDLPELRATQGVLVPAVRVPPALVR